MFKIWIFIIFFISWRFFRVIDIRYLKLQIGLFPSSMWTKNHIKYGHLRSIRSFTLSAQPRGENLPKYEPKFVYRASSAYENSMFENQHLSHIRKIFYPAPIEYSLHFESVYICETTWYDIFSLMDFPLLPMTFKMWHDIYCQIASNHYLTQRTGTFDDN